MWCENRKCYVRELSVFTDKNMSCKRVFSAVIGQRVVREKSICLFQHFFFFSFKSGQVYPDCLKVKLFTSTAYEAPLPRPLCS